MGSLCVKQKDHQAQQGLAPLPSNTLHHSFEPSLSLHHIVVAYTRLGSGEAYQFQEKWKNETPSISPKVKQTGNKVVQFHAMLPDHLLYIKKKRFLTTFSSCTKLPKRKLHVSPKIMHHLIPFSSSPSPSVSIVTSFNEYPIENNFGNYSQYITLFDGIYCYIPNIHPSKDSFSA